jgi:hypothetical protein
MRLRVQDANNLAQLVSHYPDRLNKVRVVSDNRGNIIVTSPCII